MPQPGPAPAPHRFYYLHNFQRALDWLYTRYGDLLGVDDLQFLTDFRQLPQAAQALLVRMVMRRGPWFRASKLAYDEIPDTRDAAAPLLARGWLCADAPLGLSELFALHTKRELLQILQGTALHPTMRKAEMLQALADRADLRQPYAAWHPHADEPVWQVTVGARCERLRLMFFGNLHQSWAEFVLADLGVFRYEAVPLDAASRAFQHQADVDTYLALSACRQALDEEGADAAALLQALAAAHSATPWLEQRRARVLLRVGQACERARDWPLAAQAYAASRAPGARHRQIRVLERMQCSDQALALAHQALAAPESEEEHQRVARMLPRLRRRVGQGGGFARQKMGPGAQALKQSKAKQSK